MEKNYYLYMITNKPDETLYLGVTSNIKKRIYEHKTKAVEGFSKKYNLDKLVWYEVHGDVEEAIKREKQMKDWKREWKVKRILEMNPNWDDLYSDICR